MCNVLNVEPAPAERSRSRPVAMELLEILQQLGREARGLCTGAIVEELETLQEPVED